MSEKEFPICELDVRDSGLTEADEKLMEEISNKLDYLAEHHYFRYVTSENQQISNIQK